MNYVYESNIVLDAADELSKKIGICDIPPTVRFSTTLYGEGFSLVCQHPDANLNCGTSAKFCNSCLGKERAKNDSLNAILAMSRGY